MESKKYDIWHLDQVKRANKVHESDWIAILAVAMDLDSMQKITITFIVQVCHLRFNLSFVTQMYQKPAYLEKSSIRISSWVSISRWFRVQLQWRPKADAFRARRTKWHSARPEFAQTFYCEKEYLPFFLSIWSISFLCQCERADWIVRHCIESSGLMTGHFTLYNY